MKILILTSRFGMGHYYAAEAIKEELLATCPEDTIEIVDIISVMFPIIHKLVYRFFNLFICRFTRVYNFVNSFATKNESSCVNRGKIKRLNSLIKKYDPDLIVSTWSACSRYISTYKVKYEDDIQLYTYITDITAHDGWITNMTDMYFVGTKITKEQLLSKGVEEKKIVVNGIPVRQKFKKDMKIELSNNKKKVLIMGGGLGLIPNLENILDKLYSINDIDITIITGKNKKMLKEIKDSYPNVNVIGYTNKVDKYMKEADLLITKAGGISTFEAIYSSTPLYVIKPFLSQEVGNAEFIEKMAIGKIAWENDLNISEDIISLIRDKTFIDEMKNNMQLLKSEISELQVKRIYERNIKRDVDYNIDKQYSTVFDELWGYSYIAFQKAK